jgi:hypothetical protein
MVHHRANIGPAFDLTCGHYHFLNNVAVLIRPNHENVRRNKKWHSLVGVAKTMIPTITVCLSPAFSVLFLASSLLRGASSTYCTVRETL